MLVTSPGHSSGQSILACIFCSRTVFWKKKTPWYRYRGFKDSLDIFLFLNVWAWIWGLLEKSRQNQGMKRNRHQLIFRPFCQGLVLKILNMRPTFAISPLAVIHGGKGAAGLWEVPETTRTILCPGDRLIFVEPHPEEGKKFQKCVDRCSILIAGFGSWRIRLSTVAFFHIYLEPKLGHHILEDLGPHKMLQRSTPQKRDQSLGSGSLWT